METFSKYNILAGDIDRLAHTDPAALVSQCDSRYTAALDGVAARVKAQRAEKHIVMLAGPSASGKTTTAHQLAARLQKIGVGSEVISLDDFYLPRSQCPVRDDGTVDVETVHALDLPVVNRCLKEVTETGRALFPVFDFQKGGRLERWREVDLDRSEVLIVEGIHALNPLLTELVQGRYSTLYATAQDRYMLGDVTLSTNDLRFVRRIVRDSWSRGTDGATTVDFWPYVCEGEFLYIKPFRSTCDYYVNTAFGYEPGLYQSYLQAILQTMDQQSAQAAKVRGILQKLRAFTPIGAALIAPAAMVREFIGPAAKTQV